MLSHWKVCSKHQEGWGGVGWGPLNKSLKFKVSSSFRCTCEMHNDLLQYSRLHEMRLGRTRWEEHPQKTHNFPALFGHWKKKSEIIWERDNNLDGWLVIGQQDNDAKNCLPGLTLTGVWLVLGRDLLAILSPITSTHWLGKNPTWKNKQTQQ